jgi:hypothetical protein
MAVAPTPFGVVPFAATKLVGYSLAGAALGRVYQPLGLRPRVPGAWAFGAARTLLGMVVGALYAATWLAASQFVEPPQGIGTTMLAWMALLLPVRLAEWGVAIWWFYDRGLVKKAAWVKHSIVGTAWSYGLDVPAILAVWAVPGGLWVC